MPVKRGVTRSLMFRYRGEADAAVFQSIYYGRPQGMPAFGGMLSSDLIWKLVSYLRSLPPPRAVPDELI